jgi:hypothetical protein
MSWEMHYDGDGGGDDDYHCVERRRRNRVVIESVYPDGFLYIKPNKKTRRDSTVKRRENDHRC